VKVKSVIPAPYVIPAKLVPAKAGSRNLRGKLQQESTTFYFSGFPLEFTPAKAGVGMTIATWNDKRGGNDIVGLDSCFRRNDIVGLDSHWSLPLRKQGWE